MRSACFLTAAVLAVSLAAAAQQALTTDPDSLTFERQEQVKSVEVLRNGEPVKIDRVSGYQFLVGENTYEHMIKVDVEDGKLRVQPTNQLEVGSYVLSVNTNAGRVKLDVYAPLSSMSDSLEARAERAGVSKEQMKELLGLSSPNPREAVKLGLPPVYYEGQTLVLSMEPNPNRTYTWAVNGKVVKQGLGENELVYTFREPGDHVVTYSERENGNVVASAMDVTTVRPMPPVAMEMPAPSAFVSRGPDGYRRYTWRSNGETIGNGREIRYMIGAPGVYEIECLSEEPTTGPYDQFSRTRYRVTAR